MVHVSRYEDKFKEGLEEAISELPTDYAEMIDKITDTICDAVQEKVRYRTAKYLAECVKDDILSKAQDVAESMLMNAIAGDDATIRNLFGFNDWYMKRLYMAELPTQWALIDAIAERKPDIFRDERIAQQAAQIEQLQKDVARIKNYWEGYEVQDHSGDYVTLRKKAKAA